MSASHYPKPLASAPAQPSLSPDESTTSSLTPRPVNDVVWVDESAVFSLRPWPSQADDEPPPSGEHPTEATALLGSEHVGDVFCAYRSYVAKIGRRILGTSAEVDDLIQDVFLATLKDIHKVKDPARLRAWLATVTTRMAKRRRFRSSLRPTLSHDGADDLFDLVPEDVPSPESTADLAGNIQRVLSLPDELRTPWLLKHVEGRTLQDVAAQCDCSLSTAARRIQTATGKIRRR